MNATLDGYSERQHDKALNRLAADMERQVELEEMGKLVCCGCGGLKDNGLLCCWGCFKGSGHPDPLKYSGVPFSVWRERQARKAVSPC